MPLDNKRPPDRLSTGRLAHRGGFCYKTIVRLIHRPSDRRRVAAVLLAAALALASCQRTPSSGAAAADSAKRPGPPSAPPATSPRATAGAARPKPVASSGAATRPSGTQPTAAAPPAARAIAAGPDTGVFGLLSRGAQDGNLPEDFEIGPLCAARLLGTDERAAHGAAASLLDALVSGRIERTGLAADSRDALAGMLAFALERGDAPVAWRLGPPRPSGAELVANLRLLAADGSAEGELYARREGGEFLVSDLQIDPARMRVRRERSGRTFFPSPYRWLLGG
jgi:hypothetical protein